MTCRYDSRTACYRLAAALLFAVGASASSASDPDSTGWTKLGRARLEAADQRGAIEAAEQALKLDALNVRAIELRGELMRSQFGVVAALPWFERGLQIAPDDVRLLEDYALTLGDAGRYREMLAHARKIIALDRDNSNAFYMQAVLAARAGEYELAKRILPRAGDEFNELPGAMLLDAICSFELGNYNSSVNQLQRLLALQPRNRRARTLLAQALYKAGNFYESLDTVREIAARPDADSYSLMIAARAFEASDQRERAAGVLDDAMVATMRPALPLPEPSSLVVAANAAKRDPHNAQVIVPYIRLLMAEGQIDNAISRALSLQANNPGVADAHLLVGDIEIARANAQAAVDAYQKARAISYTEPVMLRLVGALSLVGDEKSAHEALAAYLSFNPTNLSALRLAGYRHLDVKSWASAIALLERVRARLGDNDSILVANLALAYSGSGKHEKAGEYAATAYRIAPANAMVTKVYSDVLKRSGKRPKAARELAAKVVAQSAKSE